MNIRDALLNAQERAQPYRYKVTLGMRWEITEFDGREKFYLTIDDLTSDEWNVEPK